MSTYVLPSHPDNFAKLNCPPSTIICREKTIILGDVTIGQDCIVHPTAQIIARHGPIIIGANNLIEERVKIINNSTHPMTIGDDNVFEVYSHCESHKMGNGNTIECKAYVGPEVELTDNCIVGAGCRLGSSTHHKPSDTDNLEVKSTCDVFEPNTEVYGQSLNRRVVKDMPTSSHRSQLDFLRKILPNYQKLWRPLVSHATPPTAQR